MGLLSHQDILDLRAAWIDARLPESRSVLLGGIDPHLTAGLADAPTEDARFLSDLQALNETGALRDGSVPLLAFLANAVACLGPRSQAVRFEQGLQKAQRAAVLLNSSRQTVSLGPRAALIAKTVEPIDVRLYNLSAEDEWTLPVTTATTVLQLLRALRDVIGTQPWKGRVRRPGESHKFRCYLTDTDREPVSMHATLGDLVRAGEGALSLNVEWYVTFRGRPPIAVR